MKKSLSMLLITFFVLSLTACGTAAAGPAQPAETIKIGHQAALSGPSALWGQSEKNALLMEVERVNAAGGVLGKQIEYIVYDNKDDQADAVNVVKRLISEGVVAIIGPGASGPAIAAAPIVEDAKIPMIGTTPTNVKVTLDDEGAARKYTFRACFIDSYQGEVAATFALDILKVKTAAILSDIGSDSSQGLTEFFKEKFTELGGQIIAEEAFRSEELDYRAQLGKIRDVHPDMLFIPTSQKEAGLAMKQAREMGMTCIFMGGDAWASQELIDLGGAATEGGYYVNLVSLEDPIIETWLNEYRERYKGDPTMPNPVMAVDAFRLIINAIESTESTDPVVLAEYMSNAKDVPVLTGLLSIDPANHNPLNKPAVIETIKEGKFAFVQGVAAK
ncbi:MAG: ABC transporter substrate-binding protein [Clostridiales bacterium]